MAKTINFKTNNNSANVLRITPLGKIQINQEYYLPLRDSTENSVLATDGAGNTYWDSLDTLTTDVISGDLHVTGDLTYKYRHAVGSADSIAWATGSDQDVFYKINTGSFVWREADGITGAGDSATILKAGDYSIKIWLGVTTTNANDMLQVKLYVNGVKSTTSLGRFFCASTGAGVYPTRQYEWYKIGFSVGDKISVRISNTTGARAMTISDFKLLIEKIPE